jgi:hypothetical protein
MAFDEKAYRKLKVLRFFAAVYSNYASRPH